MKPLKLPVGVMCVCGVIQDVKLDILDIDRLKGAYGDQAAVNKVIDSLDYVTEAEKHLMKYHECERCVEASKGSGLNDGLDDGTWDEVI